MDEVGIKTAPRVEALGIHTLGELSRADPAGLRAVFGRHRERVQQRAAGIDDRPVVADAGEKQSSSEVTFETDLRDHGRLYAELAQLADRTAARLRARELKAAQVTVKVRRRDFTTYTRQKASARPRRRPA